MANDSITFPGWFRLFLGFVLVGGTPWCVFVSTNVMQVPTIARAVEHNNDQSDENSKTVEVLKAQLADMNRRSASMENKIDKILDKIIEAKQ